MAQLLWFASQTPAMSNARRLPKGCATRSEAMNCASDRRAGPIDNPGSRRGGRCVAGARGLVGVRLRSSSVAPSAHPNGWDDFDAEVITHPVLGQTRCLFAEAANAIRRMEEKGAAGESDTEAIVAALATGLNCKISTGQTSASRRLSSFSCVDSIFSTPPRCGISSKRHAKCRGRCADGMGSPFTKAND